MHSGIPGWTIAWTEGPGGLQSTGSQRVRHMHSHIHFLISDDFSLVFIQFGGFTPHTSIPYTLPEKLLCYLWHRGPHTMATFSRKQRGLTQSIEVVKGKGKVKSGNRTDFILESISEIFILKILTYGGSRGNVSPWLEHLLKNKGKAKQTLLSMEKR